MSSKAAPTIMALVVLFVIATLAGGTAVAQVSTGATGSATANSEIRLAGVRQPVEVYRDKWGIAHVFARDEGDLFFMQGYLTAEDRLFHMDFNRRQASGRLAEVFGKGWVSHDRLLRTVGLTRVGQKALERLTPATRDAIGAYTRGVNAFIDEHRRDLPIEFRLLDYSPEAWTPLDSIICWKWFSWALTDSWQSDAALAQIIDKVGMQKAREVFPSYPADAPTIIQQGEFKFPGKPVFKTARTADSSFGKLALDIAAGSNGWVVAGSKSVTGKPLLASNSHLLMTVPCVYYEIQLTGGAYDVTGASIPGTPGIFLGHNRTIGWSVTRDAIDDSDIFIETINPANPRQYSYKGNWLDMTSLSETIKVKGEPSQTIEVLFTRNGPVFSEFTGYGDKVVTLKWVGYEIIDNEIEPHLGINRASTFAEFKEALRHYTIGGINYHYGDTSGNIGLVSAGAIPIRTKGEGFYAVPAAKGEYDWIGIVPYEQNPFLYNPSRGYIDSANNKIIADNEYPYFLSSRAPWYRAELIREWMKKKDKFSIEDFKQMHSDVLASPPRHVVPIIVPILEGRSGLSDQAKRALALIKQWDFRYESTSTAPSIFSRFYTLLVENTFRDEVGDDLFQRYFSEIGMEDFLKTQSSWFDDVTTPQIETRDDIVAKSFEQAVADLSAKLGPDPARWEWARVNQVMINHRTPLSKVAPYDRILNLGPYGKRGRGDWTINPVDNDVYEQIVDLSNIDNSIAMMPPGNSGHVDSAHYSDQVDLWMRGDYHPSFLSIKLARDEAVEHRLYIPR